MKQIDRAIGAMLGHLIGGMAAGPYNEWEREQILWDIGERRGLMTFDHPDPSGHSDTFPEGRPTPSADQAAVLAQSLIACGGVNQEHLYYALRELVHEHKSPLWIGRAVGAGSTTRNRLRPYTWGQSQGCTNHEATPSNGSLMRATPLAIWCAKQRWRDCNHAVYDASYVTHRHPLALQCSIAYVQYLREILSGLDPVAAFKSAEGIIREYAKESPVATMFGEPYKNPPTPGLDVPSGAALLTLQIAVHTAMTARNFREGITHVVSLGGDTDAYGAVTGALLGAHFGVEEIPKEWLGVAKGLDVMTSLATELYTLAAARSRTVA